MTYLAVFFMLIPLLFAIASVLVHDHNRKKQLHDNIQELAVKYHDLQLRYKYTDERLLQKKAELGAVEARIEEETDKVYKERLQEIENQLTRDKQNAQQELSKVADQITQEQLQLDDLKKKQLAHIEAEQREKQKEIQEDYYRLNLDPQYLNDIRLLREAQPQLAKRDAVDKVIYEGYYKQPYDALMARIAGPAKICGIYKITNIKNGEAYVGQSVDIKERLKAHIKTSLSNASPTNKLYQQMKKYGPENFTFEVLELVERPKLNEREIYWIDFYKTKEFGMNVTRGGAKTE